MARRAILVLEGVSITVTLSTESFPSYLGKYKYMIICSPALSNNAFSLKLLWKVVTTMGRCELMLWFNLFPKLQKKKIGFI